MKYRVHGDGPGLIDRIHDTRQSTKTLKGEKLGVLSAVLYLTPSDFSGMGVDLYPWASPACRADCLKCSGRMKFDASVDARQARQGCRHKWVGRYLDVCWHCGAFRPPPKPPGKRKGGGT